MDGDCNIVKDLTMDRQGGNPNRQHQYGLKELNKINQNCNLIDIWRTQNKFKMRFTYQNNFLDFKSRIDRIYLCKRTGKIFCILSDILPNNLFDHHLMSVVKKHNDKQDWPFLLEIKYQHFRKQSIQTKNRILLSTLAKHGKELSQPNKKLGYGQT